jgi:enoyl-CoA hydratase
MDPSPAVTVERRGHIAIVWLNRPDQRNAFAPEFWTSLPATIEQLGDDPSIRAVVVAAKGPAFTVGLDLKAFGPVIATGSLDPAADPPGSPVVHRARTRQLVTTMQQTFTSLAQCPIPVIAAIHGYCLGAGVDLITACDIRYASADAVFSIRETRLAMVADMGTLQRLPHIIDPGSVAELAYTGRDFDAGEAASLGLVTRLLPDREATLAAAIEVAVRGTKAVLRAGEGKTVEEALDYVALWNAAFLHSSDLGEAISSFIERRPPEFKGE